MMMSEAKQDIMEFPCRFPIKAMGRCSPDFKTLVVDIVCQHAELYPQDSVSEQLSKAGNFISITVVVTARSREQLDNIYQALTDCDQVLTAL